MIKVKHVKRKISKCEKFEDVKTTGEKKKLENQKTHKFTQNIKMIK